MKWLPRALAWLFDGDVRIDFFGLAGLVAGLVSLLGAAFSNSPFFDWAGLVTLLLFTYCAIATAVTLSPYKVMENNAKGITVLSFLFFVTNVFGLDNGRFPGLHLSWWFLALTVYGLWVMIEVSEESDPKTTTRLYRRPATFRLARQLPFLGIIVTISMIAIYHEWSIWLPAVIVDAVLAAVFFMAVGRFWRNKTS